MSDIDKFASSLLEEAKRFLERAAEASGDDGEAPNLHAALMLAFCALEAHVNAVADEVAVRPKLTPHDLSILLERDVQLKDGEFVLEKRLKIHRLEDRIYRLHRLGIKSGLDGAWAEKLGGAINLRNKLTHPKAVPHITVAAIKQVIEAVIETIDALYLAVYNKRFPAAHRQLQSRMDF